MKKFLALAMALVLCAGMLAGCGEEPAPSGENTESPESGAPAEGTSFYFGSVGPLTGENAIYGNAVKNGAQIAVDEINEAGGINGYQINFRFEDDVSDGEASVNAYNTLMDDGMQVLVGPVTTAPALSVSTLVNEDRTFMLTPSASSLDVVSGKDNVFQLCFTDPNQGMGSATYIAANMPDSKVAVIYRNDDIYSTGIYETFVAECEKQNLEIV